MLPVDWPTLGAYAIAAFVIVISPGPDTLLILRYTLAGGRRVGIATVTGVQLGIVVHTAAAVVGLSILIVSLPLVFKGIAVVGALYLAYLGVQSFRASIFAVGAAGPVRIDPAKGVRDALITNVLNPKVILLFIALMPQFVRPERGSVPWQLVTLGATLFVINVAWQAILVAAAETARLWLDRPSVQRALSWGTGAILFGFAALLIVDYVL
ncbi:MAG: LysE family translocator [Alphaproteobacteria bacterium]|nr:LysE family translocator [Alphaproteobacteria bacterium]